MDWASLIEAGKIWGLGAVVAFVMGYLFINELKHNRTITKESQEAQLAAAKAREDALLPLIKEQTNALDKHTEALEKHTERARIFNEQVNFAHTCQMKEHEESAGREERVLTTQAETTRLLSSLTNSVDNLEKSTAGLKDAVSRINGYK